MEEKSFFDGILNYFIPFLILVLLGINTIIDIWYKSNLAMPNKMKGHLDSMETGKISRVLNEIGLIRRKRYYEAITDVLENPMLELRYKQEEIKPRLEKISKNFIKTGEYEIGDQKEVKAKFFLSLRDAFVQRHHEELTKLMLSFVTNHSLQYGISYDAIMSRKGAFDILGFFVAKALDKPFILYQDSAKIFDGDAVKRIGDISSEIKNPIIIDDACSKGEDILKMGLFIKEHFNLSSCDAFVFFSRTQDAISDLLSHNIKLHTTLGIVDDDYLKQIKMF